MRIEDVHISPVIDSFNPEIQFSISFLTVRNLEIPIQLSGRLLSDEKKNLTNLYELINSNSQYNLEAESFHDKDDNYQNKILVAPLNRKVLEYLESRRIKNEKNDVILILELYVRILKSRSVLAPLITLETQPFEMPPNASPVIYDYSDETLRKWDDLWLISGKKSPKFLEIHEQIFSKEVRISASDWIHDYCPAFEFGKFMVFELPIMDKVSISGTFEKKINSAINSLRKMEQNISQGEWNNVMNYSREISELFRYEKGIKDLFERSHYGEEAYEYFKNSLLELFKFASKFHHKLDKDRKTLLPEIKASKEDAYLIYSMSVAIVNNILTKINRLEIDPSNFELTDKRENFGSVEFTKEETKENNKN